MSARIPIGIRPCASGWRVWVRVAGVLKSKRFPPETTMPAMKAWRELQRVTEFYDVVTPALADAAGAFRADVTRYLALVRNMPTYKDRAYRLLQWANVFGQRDSASITSLEIRAQLEAWRKSGHIDGKALAPASLNQRRTALLHLFTVLDGKDARNPVRGVPPYREEERILRLPSIEDARTAIAAVRHPRYPKKGGTKTQARLLVLLETGWPSAILKQLTAADLHWREGTATVSGRKKGRGTTPRTVPLSPAALKALRRFHQLNAYGPFSGSALHSSLHRGCQRAKVQRFRVYDLRHVFISRIVAASGDERGASELSLHSDPKQLRRYSRQAAMTRARAALQAAG